MNAVVSNCVVTRNSAYDRGGGAYGSTLNDCRLIGNSAGYGGGAWESTLNRCALTGNSASSGGGACGYGLLSTCTLNNCALTGNSAHEGGGVWCATLNNCTLTANSARWRGGGAYGGTLRNCIVYFNTTADYFNTAADEANYGSEYATLNFCCTTPLPSAGIGNISADPQLASASHLSTGSPCRQAGSAACATGTDIDGEAWANPPSIGCDEYRLGAVTGPLGVGIATDYAGAAVAYPVDLTAVIEGRTTASAWEFGDGVVVSNRLWATHSWLAPGDYVVVLRAYSESHPAGVSATVTVHVLAQPVHYVAADSTNPLPPYTSWATAAASIQDAVDQAYGGSEIVVTNGVYATGGRAVVGTMTNRVAVDKPLTVRSVNGPAVHRDPGLPGARHHQRGLRDSVRLSDQWRQPLRLHLDQRGHAELVGGRTGRTPSPRTVAVAFGVNL
jgi:hypothetical protein